VDALAKWLTIPAASAYFYNDVLAILSLLGSLVLFLGAFPESPFKRLQKVAEWYIAPLVFGTFFQIAFVLLQLVPETETMGILVPMRPGLVNALFVASYVLVGGRWWVAKRMRHISSDHTPAPVE
jgi:hypothetical protein